MTIEEKQRKTETKGIMGERIYPKSQQIMELDEDFGAELHDLQILKKSLLKLHHE